MNQLNYEHLLLTATALAQWRIQGFVVTLLASPITVEFHAVSKYCLAFLSEYVNVVGLHFADHQFLARTSHPDPLPGLCP